MRTEARRRLRLRGSSRRAFCTLVLLSIHHHVQSEAFLSTSVFTQAKASPARAAAAAASTAAATTSVSPAIGSCGGYVVESLEGKSTVEHLPPLRNRYLALRHGQSEANMEGIISSDPAVGTVKHGLTVTGRAQARQSATRLIDVVGRDDIDNVVFVSSDFTRARQTAEECRIAVENIVGFERDVLNREKEEGDTEEAVAAAGSAAPGEVLLTQAQWEQYLPPPVVIRKELRERWFGELDGTVLLNYNKVWPEDLKDASHSGFGVESVQEVCSRLRGMFLDLEEQYEGKVLVLTSHAADERLFSQYRFKNGEVRQLLQEEDSLPAPRPLSFQ